MVWFIVIWILKFWTLVDFKEYELYLNWSDAGDWISETFEMETYMTSEKIGKLVSWLREYHSATVETS